MTTDVELAITGMTCASCANRIERKLNKLDGVVATVNYATEKAKVTFPESVSPDDLVATVEQAGYGAALPRAAADDGAARLADDPSTPLRQRLAGLAGAERPGRRAGDGARRWQFDYWQWLSLTLAAPVVVWGAWPFHRAAWVNLRHGAVDHGHAGLGRHPGRARLVGLRAVPRHRRRARHDPPVRAHRRAHRRRRQHLPRGRRRA